MRMNPFVVAPAKRFPKALVHEQRSYPSTRVVAVHVPLATTWEGASFADLPDRDSRPVKSVEQ